MTEQTYPIGCVINYERSNGDKGVGYVSFETNEFPDDVEMDEAQTPSGICDSEILYYHDTHETVAENFWDFIRTVDVPARWVGIADEFTVTSLVSFTFAPSEVN